MTPTTTLVGGPTVLIEAAGFRLVTDPTFDAPGEYRLSYVTFTKTSGPALAAEGRISPKSGDNIERAFATLGLRSHLRVLEPGVATPIDVT